MTCFSFPFYTRSLAAKISAKRPEAVTSPLATRLLSWKGPLQNHCVCPRRIDMGWERTGSRNQMKASLWEAAFWASASTNWIQCLTIPPTQTTHWGRVQHILLQNRICFQANSIFNLLSWFLSSDVGLGGGDGVAKGSVWIFLVLVLRNQAWKTVLKKNL